MSKPTHSKITTGAGNGDVSLGTNSCSHTPGKMFGKESVEMSLVFITRIFILLARLLSRLIGSVGEDRENWRSSQVDLWVVGGERGCSVPDFQKEEKGRVREDLSRRRRTGSLRYLLCEGKRKRIRPFSFSKRSG